MTRVVLMASLLGMALSGCATSGMDGPDYSDLIPPALGGTDILRTEAPPVASPSQVNLSMANDRSENDAINRIRGDALREAAQSYGSQMGFSRRAWEITGRLEARSTDLSQVYDFNRVVSTAPAGVGVIIPPVVSRSLNAFVSEDGGREASVADEYLTIVRAGRISPIEPTWRDYLLFAAPEPDSPARSLMPTERSEMVVFRSWFDEGWEQGVQLADAELQGRVDRLQRDYLGMLQYRRLVSQGMMDRLVLADADFGVTVDGDEMRIGSRTVRIVSDAQFQGNPTRWRMSTVTARDALIVETGEIPPLSSALY